MLEFIYSLFESFFNTTAMVAPYILIGVVFAGVLHILIPETFIRKQLGKKGFGSVIKSTLLGLPLPMCSCSVIPFASSLKKSGASNGAVTSFFISTPMTGIDSIIATYGVFGYIIALFRVIISFVTALAAGKLIDLLVETKPRAVETENNSCGSSCGCDNQKEEKASNSNIYKNIKDVFDYGFNQLFKDMAKPFLIGLVLAAFLQVLIPANLENYFSQNMIVNYLLVLLLAVPLYVCSISAIPIALSLFAIGFNIGAVFLFLSAAPATNIITAAIFKKLLGSKALIIYLATIVIVNIMGALVLDFYFSDITFKSLSFKHEKEELGSLISNFSAIVFLLLTFYYLIKNRR